MKKIINGKLVNGIYLHNLLCENTENPERIPEDALAYRLRLTMTTTGDIVLYARNEREAMEIAERLTEDEMKKYVGYHHVDLRTEVISVKNQKGERI